ncbi:MAG: ATP-dependent 6-phosphofructokinase [Deltaproteobacteria bacterium]|nr:ATP-dependent 6-phosphofructokinase [Deltaproteobacteria bacterium]
MTPPVKRIGILCGGGDCPGLNAVIRAVVHHAVRNYGMSVVGVEGSFQGLMHDPPNVRELNLGAVSGILARGGTILGTTNRGNPFSFPVKGPDGAVTTTDRSAEIAIRARQLGLQGLLVLGGEGTLALGWRLMQERQVPIIGVPKTIDLDLSATSATFGFVSALEVATDAVDRLHSTAESHDRVLVLEVMGRDAGHIALCSGLAGGADVILLPEIPFDLDAVTRKIEQRRALGRRFSIIVVAEGAREHGAGQRVLAGTEPGKDKVRLGGMGNWVAGQLQERTGVEARAVVLGHLQRGGSPAPLDRVLASALGVHAVDMAARGLWGRMAALRYPDIVDVPLPEALGTYHVVDVHGALCRTARSLGICLGEPE